MGVVRPYQVKTAGGQQRVVNLADCINVHRTPWVHDAVMRGDYNRIESDDGQYKITIEKPFFYTDFDRNHFFLVKPRYERHTWTEASQQLDRMLKGVPKIISNVDGRKVRVVFGMAELREKLVADEAGIDDRMVEMLKVLMIYDHPFLIKRARLRLMLEKITKESYDFIACYDHHQSKFRVGMPKKVVDELVTNRKKIEQWVKERHTKSNIFDMKGDHWVNFWRWSPIPSYLNSLKEYAQQLKDGKTIDVNSKVFKEMLKYLPRGSQLSAWAKKDLYVLFNYAKKKKLNKLQDQLFELRFDRQLDDDWYLNDDPNDIDTLWKLLKDLPDTNVEGNTTLDELNLTRGGGGWYEPDTGDIYIGSSELYDKERFEDVVRHEVGHAVHEGNEKKINPWLKKQFGWMSFDPNDDKQTDAWVELMGGYGNISDAQVKEIRKFLKECLGGGNEWTPPKPPFAPQSHPWWRHDFGPRLAFENTGPYWYDRNDKWHRYKGKAFFCNFYYQQFMVVNVSTLDLINKGMPDNYAAMSPFEFFAELYALHYDMDDPKRKNLTKEIKDWLNVNVGKASALQPKKPRHDIAASRRARPGKK
jgi:CpXC protein